MKVCSTCALLKSKFEGKCKKNIRPKRQNVKDAFLAALGYCRVGSTTGHPLG